MESSLLYSGIRRGFIPGPGRGRALSPRVLPGPWARGTPGHAAGMRARGLWDIQAVTLWVTVALTPNATERLRQRLPPARASVVHNDSTSATWNTILIVPGPVILLIIPRGIVRSVTVSSLFLIIPLIVPNYSCLYNYSFNHSFNHSFNYSLRLQLFLLFKFL